MTQMTTSTGRIRKSLLLCAHRVAFMAGWIVGGLGTAVPALMHEFGTNLQETINATVNWPVLMPGLGLNSFCVNPLRPYPVI